MALLIATYQYQDLGLRQLTAPAHDAEAFAEVLRDPAIAGFEVTTLDNEPHHRVGEAIADLYRDRRRDDLTLLYFTGHGLKDDEGRLYLAMANTRRDSLLFTGISAGQIDQAMDGCASRQKVLILDCCYSGAFPAGRLAKADTAVHALERFQGRGRTVLTASDATQYSFEGNQPHGQAVQSVFTRYLVAGLRDGSADLDGDGDITLDELYSYVHDRVVEEMPQQRPKKQDNVEGRTVIATNINWTLPTYLRNALNSPIATDRLGALDGLAHLHRIGNDTVRAHAREEIRRLVEDDSRLVSAAATARLQSIQPQPTEIRREPPAGQMPDVSEPVADTPPDDQVDPVTAPEHSSHRPAPAAWAGPAPPPVQATSTPRNLLPTSPATSDPETLGRPRSDAPPPAADLTEPDLATTIGRESIAAPAVPAISGPAPPDTVNQPPPKPGRRLLRVATGAASVLVVLCVAANLVGLATSTGYLVPLLGIAVVILTGTIGIWLLDRQPNRPPFTTDGAAGFAAFALAMAVAFFVPVRAGDDATGGGAVIAAAVLVFTMTAAVRLLTSRAGEGGRTSVPPRRDRLSTVSGLLAIGAGVLMVAGVDQQPVAASTPGFWESLPWYILGMATAAVAAGVCTLLPGTRSLIGPGLTLGAAAASTWGLVFFASELRQGHDAARWVEFVGHATLMLAAALAGRTMRTHRLAHLRPRRPQNARTWVAVILGGLAAGVGALAMSAEIYQVTQIRWGYDGLPAGEELLDRAFAYRVTAVLTVCVPLYAAIAVPRRFSLSVLAGWLGGAAAIAVSTDVYVRRSDGTDPEPILIFGCALVLLAVVATGMALLPGARASSSQPADLVATPTGRGHVPTVVGPATPSRPRRTLLLAGLAVVPLLIAAASAIVAFGAGGLPDDESNVHPLAISPDGRQVYVTRNSSVFVIDTARHAVFGSRIDIGHRVNALAVSPDGLRVYVTSAGGVSVINKGSQVAPEPSILDGDGDGADAMAVSPDSGRLYVATGSGVSVIDTKTNNTVGTIELDTPGSMAVSPDGRRLYVTSYKRGVSVIDTKTNTIVGEPIPVTEQSERMVVSPDGGRLYVADIHDDVSVIDTKTNTTIGSPIPAASPDGMAVSPDGGRLYIAHSYDSVSVIDTKTNTTVGDPIPAGFIPHDMVSSPDGRYLYVSHYDGHSVWMIDTATRRTVGIPIPAGYAR